MMKHSAVHLIRALLVTSVALVCPHAEDTPVRMNSGQFAFWDDATSHTTVYRVAQNHLRASDNNSGTEVLPRQTVSKRASDLQPGQKGVAHEDAYGETAKSGRAGAAADGTTWRQAVADKGVFDVRAYGATGDGKTLDRAAIQQAIDACAAAGGGQVRLGPGHYLSGTIQLKSDVTLFLDAGARLVGTPDLKQYDQPEVPAFMPEARWGKWHRALILAQGQERIGLAGSGVIDGNKVFDPTGEERMRGPHTFVFVQCRDVTIRDVRFVDSANYAVFFQVSDEVAIRGVRFVGGWVGVHFRGAVDRPCRDVSIVDCEFYTGDDAIAGR